MTALDDFLSAWQQNISVNPVVWFLLGLAIAVVAGLVINAGRLHFHTHRGNELVEKNGWAFKEKHLLAGATLLVLASGLIFSAAPFLNSSVIYAGGYPNDTCTFTNLREPKGPCTGAICTPTNIGTVTCQFPNGPSETGFVSCTVAINTAQCSAAITFAKTYTIAPFMSYSMNGTGIVGTNDKAITTSYFLTSPGQNPNPNPAWGQWKNMPAAQTELFGNVTNELSPDWGNGATNVRLGMQCLAGSTGASALLKLQYSIDGGATWTDTGAQIATASTSAGCITATPNVGAYIGIPTAAQTQASTLLRIVGINGAGAGDNPQWASIWIDVQSTAATQNIAMVRFCKTTITCSTESSLTGSAIQVRFFIAVTSATIVTVAWKTN